MFWGVHNRWMSYGDDGRWQDYGNPYVVRRPIVNNFSGGLIKIANPAANQETLSYTLDGNAYTISPGYSQEFREDRDWVVEFSRGENLEQARYGLQSGRALFLPVRTTVGERIEASSQTAAGTTGSPAAPANPSRQ